MMFTIRADIDSVEVITDRVIPAQVGDFLLPHNGLPMAIAVVDGHRITLARAVNQAYQQHPATLITIYPNTQALRQRVERLQALGRESAALWSDLVHSTNPVALKDNQPKNLTSLTQTVRFFAPLISRLSTQ